MRYKVMSYIANLATARKARRSLVSILAYLPSGASILIANSSFPSMESLNKTRRTLLSTCFINVWKKQYHLQDYKIIFMEKKRIERCHLEIRSSVYESSRKWFYFPRIFTHPVARLSVYLKYSSILSVDYYKTQRKIFCSFKKRFYTDI